MSTVRNLANAHGEEGIEKSLARDSTLVCRASSLVRGANCMHCHMTTRALALARQRLNEAVRSKLLRNAGWMFFGQGLGLIVQAMYFFVLARLLGSQQYGLLAGGTALVGVAASLSSMGSGVLFIARVSQNHNEFGKFWGHAIFSTAFFGSVLALMLWIISPMLLDRSPPYLIATLAISDCIFTQLTAVAGQVFQTFEKMRVTAALNLITNVLRLMIAVALLAVIHNASASLWALSSLVVSALATCTAIVVVTRNFGRPTFVWKLFIKRARQGFLYAISNTTLSVYNDVDKVMLSHYGMSIATGIYSLAYRAVNIATLPIMALHAATLPRFFQHGANGITATDALARRLLVRTFLIASCAGVTLYLLAPLIPRLVGTDFDDSVEALRWLAAIPALRSLHFAAGDALSGAGYQRFRFFSQLTVAIFNVALNFWLIPLYSWRGAAMASLLTDAALVLMNWSVYRWLQIRETRLAKIAGRSS